MKKPSEADKELAKEWLIDLIVGLAILVCGLALVLFVGSIKLFLLVGVLLMLAGLFILGSFLP